MTARSLARRLGRLSVFGILLGVLGCGGDAAVKVATGGGGGNGGTGTGPAVGGQVLLLDGGLARSDDAWRRFAGLLFDRAQALVQPQVGPADINVVVQLFLVEDGDIVDGQILPSEELFKNSTDEEGRYEVRLPGGTSAETCRFLVKVGSAEDGTLTRAFVYSTSSPIQISNQSEATVRVILETIRDTGASLCEFTPSEIENIFRAVVDSDTVVTGDTTAELNARSTAAARQDPDVQAAITAALGGPTVPPRPTDTRRPTEPATATVAVTPTNTARPTDTAPVPTNTSPVGPTASPTTPGITPTTSRTIVSRTPTNTPTNTPTTTPTTPLGTPTGTASAIVTSTRTATTTPSPTTARPTNTAPASTPSRTASPSPSPTQPVGPPIGEQSCPLKAGSQIQIFTEIGLVLQPQADGEISIDCGAPDAQGRAQCSCAVVGRFAPLEIPGIGWACVKAATAPCDPGTVDCDGGTPLSVDVEGDHDKTFACASNSECAQNCASKCGGADNVLLSGCEGFCSRSEKACTKDADCLPNDGACNGQDTVPLGRVCECTCFDTAVPPPAAAGGLSCQLAFNLQVERDSAPANKPNCDGVGDSLLINIGDTCAPLTTESVTEVLQNAGGVPGAVNPTTGPYMATGAKVSCDALRAGNLAGLKLRGATIFYGSSIGDLSAALEIDCQ